MTIPFTVKDAGSVQGIEAGDRVAFTFSKSGTESMLTSITKQRQTRVALDGRSHTRSTGSSIMIMNSLAARRPKLPSPQTASVKSMFVVLRAAASVLAFSVAWPSATIAQHGPAHPTAEAAAGPKKESSRGPVLSLAEAVGLSRGDQPAVSAFESDAIASEEAARAAGTLPDPQLTVGIQDFPVNGEVAFSPTADDFTMYTISVMREQVRRSKREAEASRLRAEAFANRAGATVEERRIQRDVMIAWINAVEAKAKQQLLDRLISDLKVAYQVTEAGIPTGSSTPAIALQTQAEIALAKAQEAEARGDEARARAALGRWIGVAAERSLPDRIPALALPPRAQAAAIVGRHPQILAAQAQEQAARRQIDVANADRKRDLTWAVKYAWRPDYGDLVSAQVSFPLLINKAGRQNRRIAEATARADAARLRTEDTKRELSSAFETALADYKSADAQLAIINSQAVPSLEASFAAAEARYGAGQGTLELPLTIVRRYVEVTIQSIEKQADRARGAAELTYLTQDVAR